MPANEIAPIGDWVTSQAGIRPEEYARLKLTAAFDVFISRCESARSRGSSDPLRSVTPREAGGNSRRCTRQMLLNLGYTNAQRRVIHRLIAGSSGGWPGLLRLFVEGRTPTRDERAYVRRQVRDFCKAACPDPAGTGRAESGRARHARSDTGPTPRTGPRPGCVSNASRP